MKISILGKTYNVVEKESHLAAVPQMGNVCHTKQEITLDSTVCEEGKNSTLLHEIIEVIDYELELKLEHNIINALETALFPFFKVPK